MFSIRAQWPHTVDDIVKALDGVWGVVGATGNNGNLFRLERSLNEPTTYKITEYRGEDESDIAAQLDFEGSQKDEAVKQFARSIGFDV
jgi:hypothetical protein